MTLQCNSSLLALASEFTGKVAPYQAVRLEPHPAGGVLAAATDKGQITALLHDPAGRASRSYTLLPAADLLRAARPLKTAERSLSIEEQLITVTTYRKTTAAQSQQFPLLETRTPFPPLKDVMAQVIHQWGSAPQVSATAGRYDIKLLARAITALEAAGDCAVLSSFTGGPMRLESPGQGLVILLMPQTALPIPPLPDWLAGWASGPAAVH